MTNKTPFVTNKTTSVRDKTASVANKTVSVTEICEEGKRELQATIESFQSGIKSSSERDKSFSKPGKGVSGRPKAIGESDVLTLIAEGHSNKEVACKLSLSVRTVETHRERIMRNLEICNAAGLTKFAIPHGLVSLDEPRGG